MTPQFLRHPHFPSLERVFNLAKEASPSFDPQDGIFALSRGGLSLLIHISLFPILHIPSASAPVFFTPRPRLRLHNSRKIGILHSLVL